MIGVLPCRSQSKATELVLAALRRSVSFGMAAQIAVAALEATNFIVAVSPDDYLADELLRWLDKPYRKLLLLGKVPNALREHFGLRTSHWPENEQVWAESASAPKGRMAASAAEIRYSQESRGLGAEAWRRPLERFDFTDEWNNLGYGAVRVDDSIWAISDALKAPIANSLAELMLADESVASYCCLFEDANSSVLWINRPVGTIDSFEWRLVERFISEWRASEGLPCRPVLSEIPFGHSAAVTMRLDCDEDISSSRFLWEVYKSRGVPMSLALHTTNLRSSAQHHEFLQSFLQDGGALLSHTATHAPNWGGSYEAARNEGIGSRKSIAAATGKNVPYAVSPFHQSPPYALQALCDVGYQGCIGGIIRNDPEFLMARGGELAGLPSGFIGHSQQCMLHGDCLLDDGDPLAIYKMAIDQAIETRTFFGYLDHPFSERYQYGWLDEESRAQVHATLIEYIRGRSDKVIFLDENAALDFLRGRASLSITSTTDGYALSGEQRGNLRYGVEYRGTLVVFENGALLS